MKTDVLESAPPTGARFEENTEVARLVETLAQVYYRIDADISQLESFRTIDDASGLELDKKAKEFGVKRPVGESDEIFRRRAKAGRTRARSGATFEEFAEGALNFLDAEPNDLEIEINYEDELGAVIINVNSDIVDNAPFTEDTISEYLEGMIPMDRRVVIRKTDGFQFSAPDTTDEKSGKGFGEGAWTE